ncbi:multidrug transporter [Bacillus canaveralius]|uniref:Multidrug transporter n=1 Tax=Bacillus canaveralius TaxID=1403243 RepID=A0A2N5GPC5_9BACI|nr:phosphodiester glycosidase family protein [Bacillus canaveralius]PLR84402.1 multidrug transporter [Bacillus canaveralius]PLS00596.1 multidrug transporter [Bacillus canaveralius]
MSKLRFLFIWGLVISLMAGTVSPTLANSAKNAEWSPVLDKRPAQSSKRDEPQTVIENPDSATLVTNKHTERIGTGVEITTFERFDARGWINGEMLKVDLGNKAVTADLLQPGVVSKAERLSETARRNGAIAGVNGDFFDINGTKAPLGAEIQSGNLVKGPEPGWQQAAGINADGIGQLAQIFLEGVITFHGNEHPLASLNQSSIPANGIGLYSSLWGEASRSGAVSNSGSVHEVIVENGKVIDSHDHIGSGKITENSFVLVGRESGASILKQLKSGDEISVQYSPKVPNGKPFEFAIGGNPILVKEGQVQSLDDKVTAPRTAVGYSADGKQMYLVTVDGRQASSRGMTLREMGALMKEFGAHHALNLDGGGSTTMVARTPGKDDAEVVNSPSDGTERAVPNGIGIFTAKGNGILTGFKVFTQSNLENSNRVFPGLTRNFSAAGFDNAYDPVETGQIKWDTKPGSVGKFEKDGIFRAKKPGKADVEAQATGIKGTSPVYVLSELERIEANIPRLGLAEGATGQFSIIGYDKNGYSAPIEPQDVSLDYDQSIIDIQMTAEGTFSVSTKVNEGSSLVTLTVNEKKAYLPVTVGLKTEYVSKMEDLSEWRFSSARGTGTIEKGEGLSGSGIKVNFDFAKSTGTRTANFHPVKPIILPGEPQSISMWVKGDGKGEWMSFTTRGADGSNHYLYGPYVTWTGWKQIEIPVPAGVSYPLELRTIGAIETNKAKQYTGQLVYDDLAVKVSPTVEVPVVSEKADPLVLQNANLAEDRWKFAVMADSQFVGKSPDSQQVRLARESLQQIIKEKPEFLIIGGDLVDTAYPEDFALAKRILEEEVGDQLPIYYVPGNHEIMGTGNLDNFLQTFKENRFTFEHKGTQFVLLDSATGSFRTSDFNQLIELKRTLETAASDPNIKNLVVFGHHPTRDPLSTKNSQLTDRKEAELIETWLTKFREESNGKGALYISGHAHNVNVERVDGVPYMVVGPAGKAPYGSADKGGFYAWTMFGIDPTPVPSKARGPEKSSEQSPIHDTEWVRAKVNPLLEGVTMEAPESVTTGETVEVKATGHQAGSLNFPLRYPASVNWTGSENVFIGTGEALIKAKESKKYIAVFDTATGQLTGLEKGQIILKVEANGVIAEKSITIS